MVAVTVGSAGILPRVTGPGADRTQTLTLLHVREISAYNDWIFAHLAPWIRGTVLEVGCGIGTYSARLRPRCRSLLCLDLRPAYAAAVRRRLGHHPEVEVLVGAVGSSFELRPGSLDAIVCLNVLEHIEDDEGAVRAFRRWLRPGGTLAVQVPAHPWLYGSMDRALGHHRRYTRRGLDALLGSGGFRLLRPARPLYALGIPGWWWFGRVTRSRHVPASSVQAANLLARLSRAVESVIPSPVGLTLVAVGLNPGGRDPAAR